MKETSLENVQSSWEESDPGPGMGNTPKNESFHYSNKNVKHDLKKKAFLSKKNETMGIHKPKPKGHSLVPVRLPVAQGESSRLERVLERSGVSLGQMGLRVEPWRKCNHKVL